MARTKYKRQTVRRGGTGSRSLSRILDSNTSESTTIGGTAPVNAVAAARVLTMDTQPVADETITIGSRVYTWKAASSAPGQIAVGADLAAAKVNLVAAINGSGQNTAHPDVTAAAFSGNTMTVTAKVKGTAANSIATTETMAGGANAWAGATLTGGVDGTPGAAEAIIYHGGYMYFTPTEATKSTSTWVRSAQFTSF